MKGQSKTRKIDKIIIHCSDTYARMNIGADEIRQWHTKERGWKDIGYHFVIRRDGTVETGRDLDGDGDIFEEVGAHTSGYNINSIGICLVGGKDDEGGPANNFNLNQFRSLENVIRIIKADYPKATVHGHREFNSAKTCPNFDVQQWQKGRMI